MLLIAAVPIIVTPPPPVTVKTETLVFDTKIGVNLVPAALIIPISFKADCTATAPDKSNVPPAPAPTYAKPFISSAAVIVLDPPAVKIVVACVILPPLNLETPASTFKAILLAAAVIFKALPDASIILVAEIYRALPVVKEFAEMETALPVVKVLPVKLATPAPTFVVADVETVKEGAV